MINSTKRATATRSEQEADGTLLRLLRSGCFRHISIGSAASSHNVVVFTGLATLAMPELLPRNSDSADREKGMGHGVVSIAEAQLRRAMASGAPGVDAALKRLSAPVSGSTANTVTAPAS
jgi:hypothetical protein